MTDVVIVSACRTAIGAFGGTLRDSHAAKIASVPMKAAVERAGISPEIINDVAHNSMQELRWQTVADRILGWLDENKL